MNKLYPNKLVFVDNAEPNINATNMNIISTALYEVDTRLAGIVPAEDYEELAEQTKANAEKAKEAYEGAEAIVGIGIATTERAGIVKPDGRTIRIHPDGTIECINGGGGDYDAELSDTSENAPQNKAVTNALDNINVYVGEDGKIHFTDRTGADSVLNFSKHTFFTDGMVAMIAPWTYTNSSSNATVYRQWRIIDREAGGMENTGTGQTTWTFTRAGRYRVCAWHTALSSLWTLKIKGTTVKNTSTEGDLGIIDFGVFDFSVGDTIVNTLAASKSNSNVNVFIFKED